VFFSYLSYAQGSKFDSIFSETSQVLLSSNPKKALSNTDYLYKISNNNTERIKASMLRATLLRQYGIRNEAISALKRAESLAILDRNYNMQARINGFLSTLYREFEIYSIGKIHLQKAVDISKKIEDKNDMYKFQGNLSQEIAYYDMYSLNYSKAIAHLKKGNQLFEKAGTTIDKNFQKAVNNELIAKNFLLLHEVDSAFLYFNKAKKGLELSQSPNSPLKGFIYNGLANTYTSIGDYKNALSNYETAEQIAETSNFFILKQEVYTSLLEFYKKTDNKKYIAYNELNVKLNKDEEQSRKNIADDLIKTLRKKQVDTQSNYQKSKNIIIGISIFIILITIAIYIFKRKQDYNKIKKFISKSGNPSQTEIKISPKKEINKEYMSEATESNILESIEKFEKSDLYLNKEISLNSVAAELGINHRYLSYVINKNKSKDFTGYINELRINYIIDCLKNDPNYLKYKISYLADQCGFLSHSRFTTTFKKVTGVSPLTFITYLQKENGEKKQTSSVNKTKQMS
jgi:AraC-like DNA-binding protein/tetratricopeptide (TPR) repeat protein